MKTLCEVRKKIVEAEQEQLRKAQKKEMSIWNKLYIEQEVEMCEEYYQNLVNSRTDED